MTGYESLLLEGEKIGFQKGKIEEKIMMATKLLQTGMSKEIIMNISGVNEVTLDLLQLNITNQFGNKTFQDLLAKHLIQTFSFFSNETVAKFTQLPVIEIDNISS